VNIGLNVVLIPAYGTVGAAIGTAATLVAHNV
jgi:O-antigen/teichoic acid export membrane protein